jgi:hypothetical protein
VGTPNVGYCTPEALLMSDRASATGKGEDIVLGRLPVLHRWVPS